MKKIIALLLIIVFCISVVACTKDYDKHHYLDPNDWEDDGDDDSKTDADDTPDEDETLRGDDAADKGAIELPPIPIN